MKGSTSGPSSATRNGHALHHQPGDEVHVARQAVELGHQHRAAQAPGGGQRRGELRPAVQRVGPLARLHLGERLGHREAVLRGEGGAALGLGLQS
jgi:hypothetical protein